MSWLNDLVSSLDIRQEKRRKAMALAEAYFGFAGANPTRQEAESYAERGGLDPMAGVQAQPDGALRIDDRSFFRDKRLREALDQNAPAVEAVRQAGALKEAGVDAGDVLGNWKLATLQRYFGSPELSNDQRVTALTGQDISPYRVSGATGYNRFTGSMSPTPLGEADIAWKHEQAQSEIARQRATDALTNLRGQQSQTELARQGKLGAEQTDQSVRTQALQDFFNNSNNPLLKADAANKKSLFKGDKIKVKMPDGTAAYYNRTLKADGTYDYSPAQDAAGEPIRVPSQEFKDEAGTAHQKEARDLAQSFGIPYEEALGITMSDGATRSMAISKLIKARQARKAAGGTVENPAYQQARNAINKGADAAKVRERLKSMGLDPGKL